MAASDMPKTLGEVEPGDLLDYGAYGVCEVAEVRHYDGGWNGRQPITNIKFKCGLGFHSGSKRPARLVRQDAPGGDWIRVGW